MKVHVKETESVIYKCQPCNGEIEL